MPSHRYLPREGLTLEFWYSHVQGTLLNPLLTGPILFGLVYFPKKLHEILPTKAHQLFSHLISKAGLSTLKVLFGLGVMRWANNYFSHRMLNNFTSDTWNHGKEIVIVTGAGGGIGEAVVRAVADSSATVIALDVKSPKTPLPPNACFYKVDITNSHEMISVANEIKEKHGDPTALVNNAGVSICRPIFNETEQQLRNIFNVNTISHFLLAKEFVPAMAKANHGHVVTVSSMAAYGSYCKNVSYTCTKASTLAFHEGLAQELKHEYNAPKVRTTIIHPGYVRTPMLGDRLDSEVWKKKGIFLNEPETLADAIVNQLHLAQSAHLVVPGRYWLLTTARGWPSWMQEAMRNSMKDALKFYGREGKK